MGTRLEPTFNPLAITSAAHSSNNKTLFTIQRLNAFQTRLLSPPKLIYTFPSSSSFPMTGSLDKFQEAINKMLQKGDVEAIRKTIQDHEDAFKNQVKELHRLYSVQKMLMEDLRKESKQNAYHFQFNNQTGQTIGGGLIFNLQTMRSDDPIRERSTGSCSGDNMRIMSRGFDLERPAVEEDMSTGVSTVDEDRSAGPSTPILGKKKMMMMSEDDEESDDVELSLSIGGSVSKKRSKSLSPLLTQKKSDEIIDSSLTFKQENSDPMSSSSGTCDQETKRPHWLFQSLKLK